MPQTQYSAYIKTGYSCSPKGQHVLEPYAPHQIPANGLSLQGGGAGTHRHTHTHYTLTGPVSFFTKDPEAESKGRLGVAENS